MIVHKFNGQCSTTLVQVFIALCVSGAIVYAQVTDTDTVSLVTQTPPEGGIAVSLLNNGSGPIVAFMADFQQWANSAASRKPIHTTTIYDTVIDDHETPVPVGGHYDLQYGRGHRAVATLTCALFEDGTYRGSVDCIRTLQQRRERLVSALNEALSTARTKRAEQKLSAVPSPNDRNDMLSVLMQGKLQHLQAATSLADRHGTGMAYDTVMATIRENPMADLDQVIATIEHQALQLRRRVESAKLPDVAKDSN